MRLIVYVLLHLIAFSYGDRPCTRRKTSHGSVCVCNSTYCDTISAPPRLPAGQFHWYSTANKKPGFNYETGFFRIHGHPPVETKLIVHSEKTFQTIRGFGGGFTDSFGYNLNHLPKKAQDNLLKSYFSKTGIEYTVCRVVLGSCDFSLREYNYLPKYDPMMKSFNLTEDDHIYKIAQMKKAQKLAKRPISMLGSIWGTPDWIRMTKASMISYVKDEFKELWANYYVKALAAFEEAGVHIWAVTPGNEPMTLYPWRFYLTYMNSVVMFPEEQREWIAENLGPALRRNGFNTSIYLLDDMRDYTMWWMDTVMRDHKAKSYVSGIALHWYSDDFYSPYTFNEMIKKYPEQEIIYSESSFHAPNRTKDVMLKQFRSYPFKDSIKFGAPLLGSWERAGKYAEDIIENLQHWVTTYIDWNLALDLDGGPNRIGWPCDAAILINRTSNSEFYKQPMFYVMGHFSKFILPGSKIVDVQQVTSTDQASDHLERPNVAPQIDPTAKPSDYKLKFVGSQNSDGSISLILYNPAPINEEVIVYDRKRGYAIINIEAYSINTIIYW